MGILLRDLAAIECRLAALAMAGGDGRAGARLIARAVYLLRLREASAQHARALGDNRHDGVDGRAPTG